MDESLAHAIKQQRNFLLLQSDWSQLPDNGLSNEDKALWTVYRQALRDITSDERWPYIPEEDLPTSPAGLPFYGDPALEPLSLPEESDPEFPNTLPPEPTADPDDVISIFGDSYPNITIHEYNPQWEQNGELITLICEAEGDNDPFNVLWIKDMNYQGMNIADFAQTDNLVGVDVSEMTSIHMDYWLEEDGFFRFGMCSHQSTPETIQQRMVRIEGTAGWNSINISLSDFAGLNMENITQFIWDNLALNEFSGVRNIWLDNVYFNKQEPVGSITVVDAD